MLVRVWERVGRPGLANWVQQGAGLEGHRFVHGP